MHLSLAGVAQIESDERGPVPLAPTDAVVLAWLAVEGPTPRARMAALLWPGSSEAQARAALRQRLMRLKKAVGFDMVGTAATLQLDASVDHDLTNSEDLLSDLRLPDAPELDAWLQAQRDQRRARVRDELQDQARQLEDAGQLDAALPVAQALLRLEPLSELAHRRVMRLHYLCGDRAAALAAFDHCEKVLKDEVGARPSDETLAVLATIEAQLPAAATATRRAVPPSVLRPPRMVGRDREFEQLEQAWAVGSVAAVIGEAGMGKSRLLHEFMQQHVGLVRAAGRPGDAGVPFATLARLLRAVGEQIPFAERAPGSALAVDMRQEIARVLPEMGDAPTRQGEGQRLRLCRAISGFLGGVRGIVVDDLHFADAASLEMLQSLIDGEGARDEEAAPMRWALAFRPAEAHGALHELRQALTETARLAPVIMAPLTEASLVELVDTLGLAGAQGSELAPVLLQRTGGNPLFVLEMLKQACVEQSLEALALGTARLRSLTVEQLIAARVARLSSEALALARVASIAGVDFQVGLAEEVLGTSAMRFADAFNELEAAQVFKGTQFAHDLVFDAVLGSVPKAIETYTHASVAAWLESHAGDPARIAAHWLAGMLPARAIPWLGRAAASAGLALRNREQLAFLERKAAAESESGRHEDAFETQMEVARLGADTELGARALERCDALLAFARNEEQRLRAGLQRVEVLLRLGNDDEAVTLGKATIRDATRAGAAAIAMECHVFMVHAAWRQERLDDAAGHADACLGWVEAQGSLMTRGSLHNTMGTVQLRRGQVRDAIAHGERAVTIARQLGVPSDTAITLDSLAASESLAGQSVLARRHSMEALLLAASYETPPVVAGMAWRTRALIELRLGRFSEALSSVTECRRLAVGALAQPRVAAATDILEALCCSLLGQWAQVGQLVSKVERNTDLLPNQRANLLRLRFLQDLARGKPDVTLLEEAIQLLKDSDDLLQVLRTWRALVLPASEGLALLQTVRERMEVAGFEAHVLMTHVRSAQIASPFDPQLAAQHARRALDMAQRFDIGTCSASELPLHCAGALFAAGEIDHARSVLQAGMDALAATARDHVPEAFRASFLNREPSNSALRALAARHGVAAAL